MRQRPARRKIPVLPRDPLEWGDTLLADHLTIGGKNADLALGVGKKHYVWSAVEKPRHGRERLVRCKEEDEGVVRHGHP